MFTLELIDDYRTGLRSSIHITREQIEDRLTGPIGFGLFRLSLLGPYTDDLVWFQAWEELTELVFVATTAWILWEFRERLELPVLVPRDH